MKFRSLTIVALVIALLNPATIFAQSTVVPGDRLGWDQSAPDASTAQNYTYNVKLDTGAPNQLTSPVTCVGTAVPNEFFCTTPFPAATPSVQHELRLEATTVINGTTVSSGFSSPLVFQLAFIPGVPGNVRRIPQ